MTTTKRKYRLSLEVEVEVAEGSEPYAHQPVVLLKTAMQALYNDGYESDDGVVGFEFQVSNVVQPVS